MRQEGSGDLRKPNAVLNGVVHFSQLQNVQDYNSHTNLHTPMGFTVTCIYNVPDGMRATIRLVGSLPLHPDLEKVTIGAL